MKKTTRTRMLKLSIAIFVAASSTALAFQAVATASPAAEGTAAIGSVERLGLTGAAIAAVVVLWRALAVKDKEHALALEKKDEIIAKRDDTIVAMTKNVTEALTLATSSNAEMRSAMRDSAATNSTLIVAIKEMSAQLEAHLSQE